MSDAPSAVARAHLLQDLERYARQLAARPIPEGLAPEDEAYLRAWVREATRIANRLRASPGFSMHEAAPAPTGTPDTPAPTKATGASRRTA